jgi:hypothetical protein
LASAPGAPSDTGGRHRRLTVRSAMAIPVKSGIVRITRSN